MNSAHLRTTDRPLADLYDVALLDLDGVVYIGAHAVPGVPEALREVRARGMHVAFVTNNAARPPAAVAAHLTDLGIAAEPHEVITSAQAAARYLADHLPAGSEVLVVGTTGLYEALQERGLTPVAECGPDVAAVVQGYSPDTNWHMLAEGAVAIGAGLPWVATNADPTVPSPRGPLPGNGSLVAALRHATGAEPIVTGKPDPTMHRETILRTGAQRPLVVGDRLDTDIEGANEVGCDSVLVFSGVTTPRDLIEAPSALRPTYLGHDVGALLLTQPALTPTEGGWTCGIWRATLDRSQLTLARNDGADTATAGDATDGLDALRALAGAAWHGAGAGGSDGESAAAPASASKSLTFRAAGDEAQRELVRLELA